MGDVLAPFLPKALVIRDLVAGCLLDVYILLLVMVMLRSSSVHQKNKYICGQILVLTLVCFEQNVLLNVDGRSN